MTLHDFPALNATLNGTSAVLLLIAYALIRAKKAKGHAIFMSAAVCSSTIFLACYLTYHFKIRGGTRFPAGNPLRPLYLTILISHTILAVVVLPLVIVTLNRALKRRFHWHKKIAVWTFPIWLYVSVTGVIIFLMLKASGAYAAH